MKSGGWKNRGNSWKLSCWTPPEVEENNDTTIGKLGMTDQVENQTVAFMKTLTDGYSKSQRPSP